MTTKTELETVFTELMDAMTSAPAPKPYGTRRRWMDASIFAVAISRKDAKWTALPEMPHGATGAVAYLTRAKNAVAGGDYGSASDIRSVLKLVDAGLSAVEAILG